MQTPSTRSRNAAQTRANILKAAQRLFSQRGYEQVGVRDIAAKAGINPALVIRYFGSKDGLFAEAVTDAFRLGELLEGERKGVGELLVRYLLQDEADGTFYPILALLRSAASPQGATLLRQGLETRFIEPLTEWLEGEERPLRASLIASTLLGIAIMQDVLRVTPLRESAVEVIVAQVAPMIQGYIDRG